MNEERSYLKFTIDNLGTVSIEVVYPEIDLTCFVCSFSLVKSAVCMNSNAIKDWIESNKFMKIWEFLSIDMKEIISEEELSILKEEIILDCALRGLDFWQAVRNAKVAKLDDVRVVAEGKHKNLKFQFREV